VRYLAFRLNGIAHQREDFENPIEIGRVRIEFCPNMARPYVFVMAATLNDWFAGTLLYSV
jgi:hypothetical protein